MSIFPPAAPDATRDRPDAIFKQQMHEFLNGAPAAASAARAHRPGPDAPGGVGERSGAPARRQSTSAAPAHDDAPVPRRAVPRETAHHRRDSASTVSPVVPAHLPRGLSHGHPAPTPYPPAAYPSPPHHARAPHAYAPAPSAAARQPPRTTHAEPRGRHTPPDAPPRPHTPLAAARPQITLIQCNPQNMHPHNPPLTTVPYVRRNVLPEPVASAAPRPPAATAARAQPGTSGSEADAEPGAYIPRMRAPKKVRVR